MLELQQAVAEDMLNYCYTFTGVNMKVNTTALALAFVFACGVAGAQTYETGDLTKKSPAKHEQRLAARQHVENHPFSDFGQEYVNFKNELSDKLDLQAGLDVSYTAQRVSPSGKQTSVQGIYYPYVTWGMFKDTSFGSGTFNFNYNLVRYWGQQASVLQDRSNVVSAFNDYASNQEIFSQLSYTHTLPGDMNWLSVTIGQYPMYNFDGSNFVDNQQTALMNFALSQNASSTYPSASLGAYVQANPGNWTFAAGYQDATNVSGQRVKFKTAFDGEYTTFGSASWTPTVEGLGAAQYSVLVYHQPSVEAQPEASTGWSVNASQDLGDKWTVFGRANGSNHGVTSIKNSYVLGASYANPLERNPQDAITLGVAYNRISAEGLGYPPSYRNSETAIELQWVWGLGKFVTVTPDLQLYPKAASDPDQGLTTVVGLRTTIML